VSAATLKVSLISGTASELKIL